MTSWFSEAVAAPAPRTRTKTRTRPAPNTKPTTKPTTRPNPKPDAGPKPKSRPQAKKRKRARGGIVWIAISAVILAGVVFVNLAVLRLNLQLDSATTDRSKLRAENASLQTELSRSQASPRIQALVRSQDGLVDADMATTGYIDLAGR